jgi:hypothetical protein
MVKKFSYNFLCIIGIHSYVYTKETYRDFIAGQLCLFDTPASKKCSKCGREMIEDKVCLGLNPPEYYSTWKRNK